MPSPEEPDDVDGFVPPLPPEDRLWRHPSEMGMHPPGPPTQATAPAAPGHPRARMAGIVVASATAGMLLTVVVLASVGVLEGQARHVVVERVAVDADGADDAPVADTLGPAVARLDVRTSDDDRSATALVYRSDGHLLTTASAVRDVRKLSVVLADGRALEGRVVGADTISGIAVVAVDAASLPTAVLGGEGPRAGQAAFAISHGPGTGSSPSVALARVTGTGWWVRHDDRTYHGVIRTTMGGPPHEGTVLSTEDGAVVGLILGFVAERGQASGDADIDSPGATSTTRADQTDDARYAVPVDYAIHIADELVDQGTVRHPWLGVDGQDLDADGVASLGRTGARLTVLSAEGPAANAGLQEGDVVLSIDTTEVGSFTGMVVALRDHGPGDVVGVRYSRDGEVRTAMVTLSERG